MKPAKDIDALISLLDDPDEQVYGLIREQLFQKGSEVIPALEYAWEHSLNELIQERIIRLIHDLQHQQLYEDLKKWSEKNDEDLLQGLILVSRSQFPDLNAENLIKETGQIIQDVWLELNNQLTALEKIKVVNHILFDIHKFRGHPMYYKNADSYLLKNLLETHKGNPSILGALYVVVARSLNIPVFGVDLPRHFILAYMETDMQGRPSAEKVMFYLSPFNRGAVFTANEIDVFLKHMNMEKKSEFFMPCTNQTIIRRMLEGISQAHADAGNLDKSKEVLSLKTALTEPED